MDKLAPCVAVIDVLLMLYLPDTKERILFKQLPAQRVLVQAESLTMEHTLNVHFVTELDKFLL